MDGPGRTRTWHVSGCKENFSLDPFVASANNLADAFSRNLSASDSMLSPKCWNKVQDLSGGPSGHNLDLISLDSNVQRDRFGEPLPHFTPYPTPGSVGVDVFSQNLQHCDGKEVNAYVFPPFGLIHPLLGYLQSQRAIVAMVVPGKSPRPLWWPTIVSMSWTGDVLARNGALDVLLAPAKRGFKPTRLNFDLDGFSELTDSNM